MTPLRLDRAAVARRLAGEVPDWVFDALADEFEPAVLASLNAAPKTG